MFENTALTDIAVTSKAPAGFRQLPPPGNYRVQLVGVGPSLDQQGNLNTEFGRPLFEVEEFTIVGPFPFDGDYKLWQKIPMTDVKEFGRNVNHLRDLVRAYDEEVTFENAEEAFELVSAFVESGQEVNVRVNYYAEDFKGKKQALIDEGFKGVPFSSLDESQKARKNEIERTSKVRGTKPFANEDGTFNSNWTSPFGNVVPVRLAISHFYNANYDPFTQGA